MTLSLEFQSSGGLLVFKESKLLFSLGKIENTFGEKNNKTLSETLSGKRYGQLRAHAQAHHKESMGVPLGKFLCGLKLRGDLFYRKFLNRCGDEVFCRFQMGVEVHKSMKGLYLYCCDDEVKYIGRSLDPFGKRVDQGYGKIHPKNCYIDGQSTNCHINSLIAAHQSSISFYVCPLQDDESIKQSERELIATLKPQWNIALKPQRTSQRSA